MPGGCEAGDLPGCSALWIVDEIEAAGVRVEPDDGRQHEDRGDHRVQEELHGRVDLASVPIHADEQRHRDQRGFPEEVEEEEVERHEDADHRRLQHQHQDEEFLHRSLIDFHEISTQSGIRKVVSTTSHNEMPSTPKW